MYNKRIFFLCLLIIVGFTYIYGIDIWESDLGMAVSISDTKMEVEIYEFSGESTTIEKYDITWEIVNNLKYLSFYYDGTFLDSYNNFPRISHGMKRYLVIHGGYFLYFYNENNRREFAVIGGKGEIDWSNITTISATSVLRENDYFYTAYNLYNQSVLIPWVEGVSGSGIGEKIRIEVEPGRRRADGSQSILSLFISNGFVDYNKPHLYDSNNRLKRIRIHNVEYNEYMDFETEDHPDIQWLRFRFDNPSYIIEIEILEVYKGSRWDDTCVNFIIPSIY